jgi:hypothetical protein
MDKTEHKSFQAPEETREFLRGRAEILNVGDEPVVTIDWFGAGTYAT